MKIKNYIVFSILLIILIAIYTYSINTNYYEISISKYKINLPVFVWIALPLLTLFIASISHMLFYGITIFLQNRHISKDQENLIELINNKLLNKENRILFKTKFFQELSTIFEYIKLKNNSTIASCTYNNINNTLNKIIDINNGKYIPSKDLKLEDNSDLMIKNTINRINEDISYAIDVLKNHSQESQNIVKKAFLVTIKEKNISYILNLIENLDLDKEMILKLLEVNAKEDNQILTKEQIIKYISKTTFTKEEFINIAKIYKNSISPDDLINIFEEISTKNELAIESYLYVLFEYEMLDDIRETFASSSSEDLIPYKLLLELKESGKQYTLDSISYKK
jgi:hypothetical protein